MLSGKAVRTLQAGAFFLALILVPILLPAEWIMPVCGTGVVAGFGGLYGVRSYLRRLEGVIVILTARQQEQDGILLALVPLLSEPEVTLLGLRGSLEPFSHITLLRDRQRILTSLGLFLGILGMVSLIGGGIAFEENY